MMKKLLAVLAVVGLSACATTPPPVQELPEITFKHLQPISLDVARIKIVDRTSGSIGGKNVEHLFTTSPRKAINNWVKDRLQGTGTSGIALVTIMEASAIEEKLETKGGITGVFTNDQSERYTTVVNVKLELLDKFDNVLGTAEARASRTKTVAEKSTLLEREKVWFEMVEKMMADFDQVIVANMQSQFTNK